MYVSAVAELPAYSLVYSPFFLTPDKATENSKLT